jgi:hypothetical protein
MIFNSKASTTKGTKVHEGKRSTGGEDARVPHKGKLTEVRECTPQQWSRAAAN